MEIKRNNSFEWIFLPLDNVTEICDANRKPINSKERQNRIAGKSINDLYPYYGATGQVGYIDDYLTDGEYILLGEDGAPFLDFTKDVAYLISGKSWVNNHAHILQSLSNNKFLMHYLNQFNFKDYVSGTTRLKLTQASMRNIPIPLPPLPEQRRIVARIEELFSDLDKGVESLKTARAQLAVYRQSVLKAAFEGRLTRDDVPEEGLPEGWEWVSIGSIVKKLDQGWSPKCEKAKRVFSNEWAVIKTTAIQHINFLSEENKKLPTHLMPRQQHEIQVNDVLITRAGPRVRVGVCCLVKSVDKRLLNCDKVYRIKVQETILPSFLVYALNSPRFLDIIEKCKSGGSDSGLNLTQNVFREIKIPLPPLPEQHAIVAEIESRLSVCEALEKTVTEGLERAETLRQSILKRAFEGRLLTEAELEACRAEPDWEPAEKLLERIRAEREAVEAEAKKRKSVGRKKVVSKKAVRKKSVAKKGTRAKTTDGKASAGKKPSGRKDKQK